VRKVNLNVIRPWIAKKITEFIGDEDEVVVEYAMGLLEDEQQTVRPFTSRFSHINVQIPSFLESRPKEDANQSHRFLEKGHTCFHGSPVETLA